MNNKNQQGIALVTALMLLLVMTLIGISSMTSSTVEIRMAKNQEEIYRSFYDAESYVNDVFANPPANLISNTSTLTLPTGAFSGSKVDMTVEFLGEELKSTISDNAEVVGSGKINDADEQAADALYDLQVESTTDAGGRTRLFIGGVYK